MEKEIALKYRLMFKNRERFYYLNLSERNFDMEKTTPRTLILPDEEEKICESSWVQMSISLFNYLQRTRPINHDTLKSFRVAWSEKLVIFSDEQSNVNAHLSECGLYINCNMTALHFVWFLGSLLDLYGVNAKETVLIYHRTPIAEPEEVTDAVIKETKEEVLTFLRDKYDFELEKAKKIIKNMEMLNGFLETLHSGYNNLFLFDTYISFNARRYKILEKFKASKYASNLKNIAMAERYLSYLDAYYKSNGYGLTYHRKNSNSIVINDMIVTKYSCIEEYFSKRTESFILLSFHELEDLLNIELPPAAYKYSSYWCPNGHYMPNHFIAAGYDIKVNIKKQLIYLFKL